MKLKDVTIHSTSKLIQALKMSIKISRTNNLYFAEITPPHGKGIYWKSDQPVPLDDLIDALLGLGCHQTDIGDVLYELDKKPNGAQSAQI